MHCLECDYDLTGTPGDRCPWCGWPIDPDALAAATHRSKAPRIGVGCAGFALGVGSLVAVIALVAQGRSLALLDGLIVLGVLLAAAGHLYLSALAFFGGRQWPIRPGEAGTVLRVIGWVAIMLALIGASGALSAPVPSRGVRGVVVNRTFEFGLRAVFFAMPGVTLLTLRMLSFRQDGLTGHIRSARSGGPVEAHATSRRDDPVGGGAPFNIEVCGRYERAQITQSWVDSRRPAAAGVEAVIAQTWEAHEERARRERRTLFNGSIGRLVGASATPGNLHLRLGTTCYRDFVGTHLSQADALRQLDADVLANPLGTSVTPLTTDGYLALGRRSDHVMHDSGRLHCFGGMLEEVDRSANRYDILGAALRELREELGVDETEVSQLAVIGLVRDGRTRQPELLFDASLELSRAQVSKRFRPELADGEHTGLEFVYDDPETITSFLLSNRGLTPIAQAALLLHGRNNWGPTWYEQTCYLCYGELPGVSPGEPRLRPA